MNKKTDKSVNTLLTSIQFLHPWHIIAVEYSGIKKRHRQWQNSLNLCTSRLPAQDHLPSPLFPVLGRWVRGWDFQPSAFGCGQKLLAQD